MDKSQLAYAIWPWGTQTREQMELAAKEVTEVGYSKFESVKAAIYAYDMDLTAYREVLSRYNLNPVSFYFHFPKMGEEETVVFSNLEKEFDFVSNLNVKLVTLQPTIGHPDRMLTETEMETELELIVRFAKIAKKFGLRTNMHCHDNTWAMYENEIDYILQNSDPDLVSFAPDTAHLVRGKCDPVEMIKRYADRIGFIHLKDIIGADALATEGFNDAGVEIYNNFLELGKGRVDFSGIFNILNLVNYDGPLCIELDRAPISNAISAKANYDYIIKQLEVCHEKN